MQNIHLTNSGGGASPGFTGSFAIAKAKNTPMTTYMTPNNEKNARVPPKMK